MDTIQNQVKDALNKRSVRKNTPSTSFLEHGKLPPQAIELEEAVLGALMLEKNALNAVIDILKPESFYKEAHQKIFAAIINLFQKTQPVDILTVTNELKKTGELDIVGGPYFITQLTNRIASAANVEYHARIVSQKHIQRELIRISADTIKDAYEDSTDVFDLLDKAESNLFAVAESNIRKNYDSMSSLIGQAIKQIEIARTQKDGISGVQSGFTELDRTTSGWQKSDLIILAARPGMGKTAFVLSLARNTAVDFQKPVAVFSLEMSSIQLVNRLIAGETELSAEKLKKGNLQDHEWQQLNTQITKLAEAPIFIDDTPALSIFELRAKCRRLKSQHDIQLIIIDYLQLMTAGGEGKGNREQEISNISRSLKSIAKELDVPIIALSQLSRAVETRGGDKRPQLSDLRESGAIEQDADMVMFIYRPEYYGITEDKENGNSLTGIAELIIAKHRNGALKDVRLRFISHLAKFVDIETGNFDSFAPLPPSAEFGGSAPSITFSSKMNHEEDDEAIPF
ncbi:MAG TPA: replicative DNA helicase [Bacteroidia bacterium]|nr:replicative DNA helicase [Bacteroidia bacterium]HRH09799.1 replicative DNA helicase [Bacteroidia bacterium]HRH64233.1 replicative DNA helicase [Bacteroidia bacterium]